MLRELRATLLALVRAHTSSGGGDGRHANSNNEAVVKGAYRLALLGTEGSVAAVLDSVAAAWE